MPKEDIKRAMEEAKHLEVEGVPTDEEIAAQYKKDMAKASEAAKLLKPVRDKVSRRKKPSKKSKR